MVPGPFYNPQDFVEDTCKFIVDRFVAYEPEIHNTSIDQQTKPD